MIWRYETKKSPWKWGLKGGKALSSQGGSRTHETKKSPWKWGLKVDCLEVDLMSQLAKQRKAPENGDWKTAFFTFMNWVVFSETKKSPWKWGLKVSSTYSLSVSYHRRNKEKPLKMGWKPVKIAKTANIFLTLDCQFSLWKELKVP